MPAFLATVPMNLPLDTALPAQCARGMPLLEAIEQRATVAGGARGFARRRGRSSRDALRKLIEAEHFDRIIVSADEDPLQAGSATRTCAGCWSGFPPRS